MKISKRGTAEPTANFTVGLIIGITLALIVAGIAIKVYQTTQATKDDFHRFVDNLESAEDGVSEQMTFRMRDGFFLFNFEPEEENNLCRKDIKKPEICGNKPCFCYCNEPLIRRFLPDEETDPNLLDDEICLDRGYCRTLDLDYTPEIKYSECGEGVYMVGSPGGLIEIYYKREGQTITLSNKEDFYPIEHKEMIQGFETFYDSMNKCSEDKEECECISDYNFLTTDYSLKFKENQIELYYGEEMIYSKNNELLFYVEAKDYNEFFLSNKPILISMDIEGPMTISATTVTAEDHLTESYLSLSANYLEVSTSLHKTDSLSFFEESLDYSQLKICNSQQI